MSCVGHDLPKCMKLDPEERYRKKHYYDKRNQRRHKKRVIAPGAGRAEDRVESEHEGDVRAQPLGMAIMG